MNLAALRERLAELEKKDKMAKLLAPNDDGLPWSDILWLWQVAAFVGLVGHIVRMALAADPNQASPPAADVAWLLVLGLVVLALRYSGPLVRTRAQRTRQRLRRDGVLAAATTVQVNNEFFSDGNQRWLPGSILVSFDPRALQEPDRFAEVAGALFRLRCQDRRTLPSEHAAIAWDLYHSMWLRRALHVPPELCAGFRDCRLVTVMFPPEPLQDGELLLALALPGELTPEGTALLPASLG